MSVKEISNTVCFFLKTTTTTITIKEQTNNVSPVNTYSIYLNYRWKIEQEKDPRVLSEFLLSAAKNYMDQPLTLMFLNEPFLVSY